MRVVRANPLVRCRRGVRGMTPRRALFAAYGIFLLAIVVWFVADFPLWRGWIALGFLLYAVALWRWPVLWLYALPALLPLFDLAPWSGRFFFDEFDALVLLTAGILALRDPGEEGALSRTVWTVIALLCASYAISALIVLWPPPKVTADSFANYDSPYNALRVGKGFLWALLLLRPMRQAAGRGFDIRVPIC